jgi:hypothetical protein
MIGWNGSRASGERHRARPTARLWIGKVRRACYFSPLALGLALMLLAASFTPMAAPGFATRAEAQASIESCAPSKDRIIQEICEQIPPNVGQQ